jgi:protein-disulfide isomerase
MLKKENLFLLVIGGLAVLVLVVLMFTTFGTSPRVKALTPQVFSTDPYLGKSNAKVTLVIFTDFECEYCRSEVPVLKSILAANQKTIKLVYKDFPLAIHKNATRAAEIARCAQDQDKFWQMHDLLFQSQDSIDKLDLDALSKSVGIDAAKLKTCLDAKTVDKRIQQNISEGQRLEVAETPTLFINEKRLTGLNDESTIQSYIDENLQ